MAAVRVPRLLTLSMPVCSCVHRIMTQDPVYGLIPGVLGFLVHSGCSPVTYLPVWKWEAEGGRCSQSGGGVIIHTQTHLMSE